MSRPVLPEWSGAALVYVEPRQVVKGFGYARVGGQTPEAYTSLQGPLIMRLGDRLEQEYVAQTGDFFVPPHAVHPIANPRQEGEAKSSFAATRQRRSSKRSRSPEQPAANTSSLPNRRGRKRLRKTARPRRLRGGPGPARAGPERE